MNRKTRDVLWRNLVRDDASMQTKMCMFVLGRASVNDVKRVTARERKTIARVFCYSASVDQIHKFHARVAVWTELGGGV